ETGTGDGDGDDQCAARVSRPAGDRSDPSDRSDRAARLVRAADFRRWRSVVLNITSRCALDCLFCNEKDFHFKAPDLTFEEIVARLEGYAREGYQSVCMMSGDVLLHRDFERVVEWIGKKQGMVPAFATTGERLDDLSFLERLVARGLRHIEFSLASHRPEDADLLAGRRGIGARQRRALANIGAVNGRADRPLIVSLNVILNSINAPYLRDTVAFALDALGRVDWVSLKAVQIAGNARRHPFLALPYHRLAPAAAVAAALLEERGENYFLDNFPLCALPRGLWERSQYAFLVRSGQRLRGENYDGRFDRGSDFAARGHDHDPVCSTCDAAPICPGFPGEYGRLFGEREKTALADVPAAADVA
ncbi:MAG: radical SAM protein, partial [Planctomycetes bacterium]|nr:radical SAM protein [Planctomycetota bacterium]